MNKLQTNVARDIGTKQELEARGWNVVVIWECETKSNETLIEILTSETFSVVG